MPPSQEPPTPQGEYFETSIDIILSITTSPRKLIQAACQFQLDKNVAEAKNRELLHKLADVMSDDEESDSGHQLRAVIPENPKIRPWTFTLQFNPEINEAEWFITTANKAQWQLHEIWELLGPELANVMSSESWIADTNFKSRIGWVDNGQGSGSYSSINVEILHKDNLSSYNLRTAFLNPILMQYSLPLFEDQMQLMICLKAWNPTCWALSGDECLQCIGGQTGINYAKVFDEYIEILVKGLCLKKRSVVNIFKKWDEAIFPNSDTSLATYESEESQDEDEHWEEGGGQEEDGH
ncbi:hypothetical protein BDQ17DRAFT_1329042 [Cyathus striatus]|nr:hypothetical protein BDQ17DRAFT_1329042 [Cyathus striatus]